MAASSPAPPRTVQFGGFELDLARAELRKGGAVESLPPQPLRVLVLLASRAGDLVTRETIRQELWGEDVSVDFDHGLNTCIRQIRAVLGDEARSWRFIETVHRRGYRFHLPAAPPAKRLRLMHWKLAAGLALAAVAFTMAGYGTVSSRHSARLAQAHDLVVEGGCIPPDSPPTPSGAPSLLSKRPWLLIRGAPQPMRVWRSLISAWRLIGACGGRTPPGKQPRRPRLRSPSTPGQQRPIPQ